MTSRRRGRRQRSEVRYGRRCGHHRRRRHGGIDRYNLAERGAGRIVLVERDVPGSGSTSKAAGGVRCQFSDEVNIALSVRSLEILRSFESTFGTDIDLVSNGYLFLLDSPESAEMFAANVALQQRLGLDSQMLTVDEVAALAPYVDTTGLVAGAFNPGDGHCTPEAVVAGYITAARDRGVTVVKCCEVTGIVTRGENGRRRITSVETTQGRSRAHRSCARQAPGRDSSVRWPESICP